MILGKHLRNWLSKEGDARRHLCQHSVRYLEEIRPKVLDAFAIMATNLFSRVFLNLS